MPSEPKRKLAAIMFTDMVGYTALMQDDEPKARKLIERHRAHMKPFVEKHGGEIIQFVGDGTFCRFDSAIEAVNSAVEIQKVLEMEPEINLRIGIHVGDVVVDGDEVYGDGVNVASRLESLAEPGGICLSGEVYTQIKNQPDIDLIAGGSKELKNVKEPVDIYFISAKSDTKTEPSSVISPLDKSSSSQKESMSQTGYGKFIYFGAAALVLLLVVLWNLPYFSSRDMALEASGEIRSIAILPLDNMSNDPDQEYFSDGMTEALIANIAKIRSLKVISRTSVMRYKGTDKSLPEIAKELKVDAILEGSVMHAEGEVRITVQLIRAATDEHLWAESYTDKLENIMILQSKIARAVAGEIKLTLTPEEEKRINEKPTDNVEAYDYYLRGNDYLSRSFNKSDFTNSLQMNEKAVELDPNFALAYSNLSFAHSEMYWFYYDRTEERLRRSKKSLDRALMLNPDLPEAHVAYGWYFYHGFLEYENALKEFGIAIDLGLNSSNLYMGIASVQRRQGRMEEAVVNFQKAEELDPRSSRAYSNTGQTYDLLRRYEEAERHINKALSLRPEQMSLYYFKMFLYLRWEGDLQKARAVVAVAEQNVVSVRDPFYIGMNYFINIYQRRFEDALSSWSKMDERAIDDQFNYTHEYHIKAKTHGFLKNSGLEKTYYDSALTVYKTMITAHPDDSRLYSSLGLVYAGLNRKEDAIREGKKGVELLPISKEALRGAQRLEDLAVIYAQVGEYDSAIDHIETLLTAPTFLSVSLLRLNPKWDPLREHPRFIKLIANSQNRH